MPAVGLKNTDAGPVVFSDDQSGLQIEWQGTGDPSGDDIHYVPEDLLQNVNLMRAMQRGLLVQVDEADAQAAAERGAQAWKESRHSVVTAAAEAMDAAPRDDMVSVGCYGPGPRGTNCDNSVIVKLSEVAERPPLCPKHANRADEFEVVLTENNKKKWQKKEF